VSEGLTNAFTKSLHRSLILAFFFISHDETARKLKAPRLATAPKGPITEEIPLLLTGAIYGA